MSIYSHLLQLMSSYERYWRQYHRRNLNFHRQASQRALSDMQDVAANPYVDVADMKALQRAAYFGGHGRRHRRRGHRRPHPHHWRPFHRRWKRRRMHRPVFWQPAFADNLAITLQGLASRINLLWSRLPNRAYWVRTRQVPYRRTPGTLFNKFPVPA